MARLGWQLTALVTLAIVRGSCAVFRRVWMDVDVSCGRHRCHGAKLPGSLLDGLCGFECATPLAVIPKSVDAAKQALDPPMSPPWARGSGRPLALLES